MRRQTRSTASLIRLYEPLLDKVLTFPKMTLALACLLLIATLWPLSRLGKRIYAAAG